MRMRMLPAVCLANLLSVASFGSEVPKKSCGAPDRKTLWGEAVKVEKLRCSLTQQEIDSCCCVQREGRTHCTLANKDVEACCCRPAGEKTKGI